MNCVSIKLLNLSPRSAKANSFLVLLTHMAEMCLLRSAKGINFCFLSCNVAK